MNASEKKARKRTGKKGSKPISPKRGANIGSENRFLRPRQSWIVPG